MTRKFQNFRIEIGRNSRQHQKTFELPTTAIGFGQFLLKTFQAQRVRRRSAAIGAVGDGTRSGQFPLFDVADVFPYTFQDVDLMLKNKNSCYTKVYR